MQISLDPCDRFFIKAYDHSRLTVQHQQTSTVCQTACLLTPTHFIDNWPGLNLTAPDPPALKTMFDLKATLILLPTSAQHKIIPLGLQAKFIAQSVIAETMRFDAACRTYNILCSEGRHVLLAVFDKIMNLNF